MKVNFCGSAISLFSSIPPVWSWREIRAETMLYSASTEFAFDNAGPITFSIMNMLKDMGVLGRCPESKHIVIDSRVHMLMPGQYPCIPGWHCDGVKRNMTGQPDIEAPFDKDCLHYFVHVGSDAPMAPTEYIPGELRLTGIEPNRVWGTVDREVNEQIKRHGASIVHKMKPGSITEVSQDTLHRCPPAEKSGWRFFFRLSYWHSPPKNEIRNQTQVYALPEQGW